MSKWFPSRWIGVVTLVVAAFLLLPPPADATHSWGGMPGYHWFRSSSAIKNIPVRRLLSSGWVTRYNTAVTDWRKSAMTKIRPYTAFTGGQSPSCPTVNGQVSVCDGKYGANGWLGLATIWINSSKHILRGTAKMNNTYFNTSTYNKISWRQLVMCQEIGHTFGLGHVNEVFNNRNVGSCMDYTNDPDGGGFYGPSNMHPYAHDYALINSKHNHIGFVPPGAPRSVMPSAMAEYNATTPAQLGGLVWTGNDGRTERYEIEFGDGFKVANWVIWADAR